MSRAEAAALLREAMDSTPVELSAWSRGRLRRLIGEAIALGIADDCAAALAPLNDDVADDACDRCGERSDDLREFVLAVQVGECSAVIVAGGLCPACLAFEPQPTSGIGAFDPDPITERTPS